MHAQNLRLHVHAPAAHVHAPAVPTSRVCSSLNGSILQVASRCTDRQLPREHFYSPDTPEGCRLEMPPDSTKVSLLQRAPLPKKPRGRAPLRREPRENFGLSRHLQTRFHRIRQVVVLHTLHAEILLPPAPLPLPNPPKSQPFFARPPPRFRFSPRNRAASAGKGTARSQGGAEV